MYLDKTSRKVLKYMQNNNPNMADDLFTQDVVQRGCNLSSEELRKCLTFLEFQNLVHLSIEDRISKHFLWGFSLTHQGRYYREFQLITLCQSILKSVLLPIVVSVFTAVITALLIAS